MLPNAFLTLFLIVRFAHAFSCASLFLGNDFHRDEANYHYDVHVDDLD